MIDYPQYRATTDDVVKLIQSQRLVRLVTVDPDGWPRLGVYVFVHDGADIEMHLLAGDPQLKDIESNGRAIIEFDETLSSARSDWVDPSDALHADQFYCCATIRGNTEVLADAPALVTHLNRLLERYQPESAYTPVEMANQHYVSQHSRLKLLRIRADIITTKFKLAQKNKPEVVGQIITGLRDRGTMLDLRTAALMETALANLEPRKR